MAKITFFHYPKCSTCIKASKWLKAHNIEIEPRNIVDQNPSSAKLVNLIKTSGLPILKFFNTSGTIYKERNLKEVVKKASDSELIDLLSTNGMLVKRPIIASQQFVLVGFNESEWLKTLNESKI